MVALMCAVLDCQREELEASAESASLRAKDVRAELMAASRMLTALGGSFDEVRHQCNAK